MRKAQSAIEVLINYGWMILIVVILILVLYYYRIFDVFQNIPAYCNFGSGVSCTSFKFQQKNSTDTSMWLVLVMSNGLGHDISFVQNGAVVTTQNIGKMGVQNYAGTCYPVQSTVKAGDKFACRFQITDTQVVPSIGRNVKLAVRIDYLNCDSDVHYASTGSCSGGLNRSIYGEVSTPYESYGGSGYCGDGICNSSSGETSASCDVDCQPTILTVVVSLTSPANGGHYHKLNVPISFTVSPAGTPVAYSLDSGRDVNASANAVISGPLPDGWHTMRLYSYWASSTLSNFSYCLGDVSDDGKIDSTDASLVSSRMGCNCTGSCWDGTAAAADINGDCVIDQQDMAIVNVRNGTTCPP